MADRQRRRRRESTTVEGRGMVRTQRLRMGRVLSEDKKEIEFDAHIFETEPAYVRVGHGVTKNLGEYESMRIDVSISIPCYIETIDEISEDCGERVAILLEKELDAYGLDLHGEN